MELQLGLKITRTREDVSSSVDFRFSKDPFGPLVLSRETNSRFIIIIHLKGFKKEGIEIEINREGNRITIGGRKPVEEMVLIRWMAWKREVELRAFRKVFLIPDVVDLDKIKARFDDDDATLTITMPKRVYGISGFKLEEEEDDRVDSGDVSEVENREETTQIREEVEEENVVREESDEHSQIQRVREMMENKERENQVSEGEEKGFIGGLGEEEKTQIEDDNLEKIQQINEQETIVQQELADSNTESEDSSLRKLPDITEQESDEQVMEKQVSQVETKSDDVESRAFEEIEEQEPDEQLDRTSKSREMEKKTTDGGDDDDGLRKVQRIEEPERHNKESNIHEMVEGETGGQEKKKEKEENSKVRRQSENRSLIKLQETEEQHSKGQKRREKYPEAEANIGNDTPKPVQERCEGKHKILENTQEETNNQREEYEEKFVETGKKINDSGASKVQEIRQQELEEPARCDKESKTHKLVKSKRNDEEKEEKKIAETETTKEQEPHRPKLLGEQEKLQDLTEKKRQFSKNGKLKEEEKFAEKKTEFGDDDISRNVRDIDQRDSDAKETGEGFTPKVADTETKDKVDSDEVDEIHELVEKKEEEEENAKVGRKSEDSSVMKKLQEKEQQFHGQNRRNKQKKIKELVEEKTPEAETNIGDEIPKPAQEIEEPEVDTLEKCDENEIADTETKEQETYIPKILGEQGKIRELAEERTNFSRKVEEEEETAERKTKFSDDDMSRKVRNIEQQDSVMKGQEEKDKIQELVLEEKVSDGRKEIIAVAEKIAENDKPRKVQEINEQQSHEDDKRVNQFQKLIGGEISGHGEVENVENEKEKTEADNRFRDSVREAQEVERKDSDVSGKYGKRDTIQELQENRTYQNDQVEEKEDELVNLKNQLEQDSVEVGGKTQELVEEKIKDCKGEKSETETKTNDAVSKVQGIKDQVEEKSQDCKEEKSETKTDDVVRKVKGIKEQELYEPKGDHVSKNKELVVESEVEAERGGLSNVHGSEEEELHEPNIHKERDKTRIAGREEPSGQEKEKKEKIAESMITTEKENSKNVQELRGKRPNKPESHEKQHKILEVVEAKYNDSKKPKEEKIIVREKLETEEDSSKKFQEIEKRECDGLQGSIVQDKKQETEEKEFTRAMEENEIVDSMTKTKDGSLRKVQDDEDPEFSKPYKRREEDKIQELVEIGKSDYREKVKKQERGDILRSQEGEIPDLNESKRNGEKSNIPQLVEEEKVDNISELGGKMQEERSGKFHEFEERKSYEEQREATDPKDKHTGGGNITAKQELKTEEGSSKKVQEIEKQEYHQLQRSKVEDKMQETEEKDKTREMEENEIVERRTETKDGILGKIREGEDPELDRHKRHGEEDMIQELVKTEISDHREKVKKIGIVSSQEIGNLDLGELESHRKQRKIHQSVEDENGKGKMEGDYSGKFHEFQNQKSYEDWRQEESEEIENFVKENATYSEDKHRGGKGEHEEDRYEKVAQTKTKVEEWIHKEVRKNKEPESDKQERYRKLDKLGGLQREGASDRVQEKILVDDFTTDIKENEKEESHESERHEKLDIVQDFVEDETGDQEDEEAEEAAAVVANNEKDSLRKFQTIEEHKEQKNTPKRSDPEVKAEDEERLAEKETKEQEAHVQELEKKTENCKYDDGEGRRGEKGKQRKNFERNIDDRIVRKIRETKVQESNEKNDQEPGDKIEELERKETSTHEVKLVTEDDSLKKGQELLRKESSNVSNRRPVEQEKIQQLKEVEKREDGEKTEVETKANNGKSRKFEKVELNELEENEELTKIRKPMEEKTNALEKEKEGNERIAEEEMQNKIDTRIKDQEIKRQEPSEILENREHDKIPEPIVKGTKHHREEEKEMADRESEEMKRVVDDVSSRKVEKIKARESNGLEKHKKLSEIQENQSVEEKIQGHGEEEMNEGGGHKTVLKTKSLEDISQSQDAEDKGSVQTKRYAEQEKIQELTAEEDGKKEHHTTEGEQKEKAMRILQVESKANDDSSKKNETEEHETTRLRWQKKKQNNQEVVEIETSDQRREEKKEEVVEKSETVDEYDSSRKIHEHEEQKPYKLVEMSRKVAEEETNDDKEGNRAGADTKIKDGGFEEEEELAIVVRHREQHKKKSIVEKDTSGKAKENKNQEAKSRDDSSRKTQEKEEQESHEQKRNYEEQDKNLSPNYCRNEEDGKEHREITEAEGPRKLKGIENRESTKTVERNANRDNIHELVEERMKCQEGENRNSMITEVLEKSEDHESEGPEGLRNEDKRRELVQQRLTGNHKNEETTNRETKIKHNESRKTHQTKGKETGEEERREEQGRIKELVDDRTHYCRGKQNRENEFGDGSSKKIQGIEKEKSIEPGRNEKRDEIQEPVESEDDEEELEVEFEESEEDWEAEVIQEIDSDEDNDKIRQIRRINLGFQLVGGSALFMSLIVIVIHFVRSKRKIRCYKF